MDADALATALNIMSISDGMKLVESLDDVDALWVISKDGKLESVKSSKMRLD